MHKNEVEAIDIETCNLNSDSLFSGSCNKMADLCNREENSTQYKAFQSKNSDLTSLLEKKFGINLEFYQYMEQFESMIAQNLTLPVSIETYNQIYNLSSEQMRLLYSNVEITQLGMGYFMNDFLEQLQQK